jgi:hypothetical protein
MFFEKDRVKAKEKVGQKMFISIDKTAILLIPGLCSFLLCYVSIVT